jgi:hypothetical protein
VGNLRPKVFGDISSRSPCISTEINAGMRSRLRRLGFVAIGLGFIRNAREAVGNRYATGRAYVSSMQKVSVTVFGLALFVVLGALSFVRELLTLTYRRPFGF